MAVSKPKPKEMFILPSTLLFDREGTKDKSAEIAVAAFLSWISEAHGKNFVAIKIDIIAKNLGWSKRKTIDVLKRLEKGGYIIVERRTPLPNRYRLAWSPALPSPTSPQATEASPATSNPETTAPTSPQSSNPQSSAIPQHFIDSIEDRFRQIEGKMNHIEATIKGIHDHLGKDLKDFLNNLSKSVSEVKKEIRQIKKSTTPPSASADMTKPGKR